MGAAVLHGAAPEPQEPTFRSEVDYIAVDVQVVDGSGRPVERLGPDKFEVSIAGKRRRVVSADFLRNSAVEGNPDGLRGVFTANGTPVTSPGIGRVFMMAIDESSFTPGESKGIAEAVRGFIGRLQPDDFVGLYSYPLGPKIQPTTDHAALVRRLEGIAGSKRSMRSEYNLSPMEVVDITAQAAKGTPRTNETLAGAAAVLNLEQYGDATDALRRVALRECGVSDLRCLENIQSEAQAMAFDYENQATRSLFGLRGLVNGLSTYPGRKTVVVMSGGMLVSDRPGGRPDIGELPKVLGKAAAEANIAIYALHVDNTFIDETSARVTAIDVVPGGRFRDPVVLSRVLSDFTAASGGALFPVMIGSGETALERVLRETSAHYLLAVEPQEADRDGKLRELRVRVKQDGATIRSRMWVVIPRRGV
jgi:VWFA-related protein